MSEAQLDVLCYGNAIVDLLAEAEDEFLEKHQLTKSKMHLIDEEQAEKLYKAMGPVTEISGGSAANTAVGLASFGAKAGFVGKVKNDTLGKSFAHDIRAAGVDFRTPPAMDGPATARSMIFVTPDGERTMNTFLGACQNLTVNDVDEEMAARAKMIYLEGYLWDPRHAIKALMRAARIAKTNRRKVALTLSDMFCVDKHREEFTYLINEKSFDIIFANEAELTSLYETSFNLALASLRKSVSIGVVTRSEKGCVIVKGDETYDVDAYPVDKLVDTTGAGDLFASGFLFGLIRNLPLQRCGELGCLAAAEIISHIGARPQVSLKELAKQRGLLASKAA